ncbi:MAG: hypothetical protein OSB39_14045 [Opitutales bacterium]|nr:hypothetical protein [Opitutales bacterium]
MSSHTLDSTRSSIGLSPHLASIRDRRHGGRRNPNRKHSKDVPHLFVKLPADSSDATHPLLDPEMIEPSLRNVEQALDNGPQEAKHTHRNDPWKVKQILLSGPTTDRI